MNLKALELTEELKDGFLEMIAKREAQQAMNHADNARTYSRRITFLQSTKNPCNFDRWHGRFNANR